MLIGRESKLDALEKCYASDQKFAVVYGNHRYGKTSVLTQFAQGKKGIVFHAERLNSFANLRLFEKAVSDYSGRDESFPRWKEAFIRIADFTREGKFLLTIDDFADLVSEDKSILADMEYAFENEWRNADIFVLGGCGRVYFTETEILSDSLYRRPMAFKLDELDYFDSAKLLPESISDLDRLRYYCCLGGVPEYLCLVKAGESFEKNIKRIFLSADAPLYSSVPRLMMDELREPEFYNSILFAIARGARRINEIVSETGESSTKVNKYLLTLLQMQIVSRNIPFGDDPSSSRKGVYNINSKALSFWFRFVLPNRDAIVSGRDIDGLVKDIDEYILSKYYAEVCEQYMLRQNRKGNLPILASQISGYWETLRDCESMLLIGANPRNKQILIGTFKGEFPDLPQQVLKSLRKNDSILPEYWERYDMLFSYSPFGRDLLDSQSRKLKCVPVEDLYSLK